MKRVVFSLTLILATTAAMADFRTRDVLLTDSGVLYVIESADASLFPGSEASTTGRRLVLRVFEGAESKVEVVPASLTGGMHLEPALAFDERDKRLYVFWQRIPNPSTSELHFTSYKEGEWSEPHRFGDGDLWVLRMNLRIAITNRVASTDAAGQPIYDSAMIAHAIWWEQRGATEQARYAMLELESGVPSSVQLLDLHDVFPPMAATPHLLPEDFDRNVLRTPFIFRSPNGDGVEVLFANWTTNRYRLGTIRPVGTLDNGVIRIPIGFTGRETNPPLLENRAESNSSLSAIRGGTGRIVVYTVGATTLQFTVLNGDQWSPPRALISEGPATVGDAVEALRRLAERDAGSASPED